MTMTNPDKSQPTPKATVEKAREYLEKHYPNHHLKITLVALLADFADTLEKEDGWIAVADKLPKPQLTVWLSNGKGWVTLGCLVETRDGWHWAEGNGVVYEQDGEIISECESEDLDVAYWHTLPSPPKTK